MRSTEWALFVGDRANWYGWVDGDREAARRYWIASISSSLYPRSASDVDHVDGRPL